jgi:hypothetical protein
MLAKRKCNMEDSLQINQSNLLININLNEDKNIDNNDLNRFVIENNIHFLK